MANPIGKILGRRIRRIRQERGLTLKQIEAKVDVSATHISEIERGKTSPTVGALERIAQALEVQPSHLIDIPLMQEATVQKAEDARPIFLHGGTVRVEPLTNRNTLSEMSLFIATVNGGGIVADTPGHRGEEFCYVLDGFLEVKVNGKAHVLRPGDSIHFKANHAHEIRNLTRDPVRAFWAVRPKLFI
ncbi:MAG: cupin domain-containing protein [Candidatus Eisenbacteria bacterium]|nr:cupin domain-containing protein [Candidatus Eisenbacteria bacterium]